MLTANKRFQEFVDWLVFSWWNPLIAAVATIWLDLQIGACRKFFELLSTFLPHRFLAEIFYSRAATTIFVAVVMLLLAPFIRLVYFGIQKFIRHQVIKKRQQEKLIENSAERAEKAMNLCLRYGQDWKRLAATVDHLEMRVAHLSEQIEAFKNHAYGDILQGG